MSNLRHTDLMLTANRDMLGDRLLVHLRGTLIEEVRRLRGENATLRRDKALEREQRRAIMIANRRKVRKP